MFLRKIFPSLLILSCLLLTSCKYNLTEGFYRKDRVEKRTEEIKNLSDDYIFSESLRDSLKYSVVVITDVHFGKLNQRKDEEFLNWFEKQCLNPDSSLRPAFVICLGDSVEYGTKKEYEEYLAFTNRLKTIAFETMGNNQLQIFNITGNHDLYNSGWNNFKKMLNPLTSFYAFNVSKKEQSFHWYFLDSGNGTLGRKQINLLKQQFKKDKNPKFVFTHYPLYQEDIMYFTTQNTDERDLLMSLYAKNNVKLVLAGHHHPGGEFDSGKYKEIGIPSYYQFNKCGLLTVDEENSSYILNIVNYLE